MAPCVGKKKKQRGGSGGADGLGRAVGWGLGCSSFLTAILVTRFLFQHLAISAELQSIQSDLHVFKHF